MEPARAATQERILEACLIALSVAEYWGRTGAIASTVEMVKAALTGSKPELRSNEKVQL